MSTIAEATAVLEKRMKDTDGSVKMVLSLPASLTYMLGVIADYAEHRRDNRSVIRPTRPRVLRLLTEAVLSSGRVNETTRVPARLHDAKQETNAVYFFSASAARSLTDIAEQNAVTVADVITHLASEHFTSVLGALVADRIAGRTSTALVLS